MRFTPAAVQAAVRNKHSTVLAGVTQVVMGLVMGLTGLHVLVPIRWSNRRRPNADIHESL
jgi:hypothetical protein